ncbi:cysteine-rich repeat secretory protein 1-like [Bidens hawaiensis]|uniref:cysteine-rich repeat secretory protein 1-like n=1 Tax=Bidens hawaiensis TaxID=980011 RepID=UPI0040493EDA
MAEPIYTDIFRCKKDSGTYQPNSPYKTNLMAELKKAQSGTGSGPIGNKADETVYVVTLCAGYLKPNDCTSCINKTIPLLLEKCPNQKGAAAWRVTCMVRYGTPVINNYDVWFLANEVSPIKAMDVALLEKSLSELVSMSLYEVKPGLRRYVYKDLGYGKNGTLHMVMQCTDDLLPNDCHKCLIHVSNEVKPCCNGAKAAAVFTPNCYIRYSLGDFREGGNRPSSITIN